MSSDRVRGELVVAVTLACLATAGYGASARVFMAHGGNPQFYQEQFAPAVLMACGRGFENAASGRSSALDAFLAERSVTLGCADLPTDALAAPLTSFQQVHRYLLLVVALTWRIFGISWPAVMWLAGAFGGVSVLFGYLLFRAGTGRALAIVLTSVWAMSPLQLGNMPNLRDYAKAPYFLLMVCAVACLAQRRMRAGWTWALMAASGALLGFGFGMRTDVMLYLVPLVATLVLFRPGPFSSDLVTRLVGAVLAVAAFGLVARPILQTYGAANNFAHVALLGLTDESDDWLQVNRTPYSFGYLYDDGYVATVVSAYGARVQTNPRPLRVGTKEYEVVSNDYYGLLMKTFPADMLVRCWAAVVEVFKLPFRPDLSGAPVWLTSRVSSAYALRAALLEPLGGLTAIAGAFTLAVLVSIRNLRLAVLFALMTISEAGLGALQFQGRHIFHLEILPLWVYGCLATVLFREGRSLLGGARAVRHGSPARWLVAPLFALGLVAIVGVPLAAARMYQVRDVTVLLDRYENAETESLIVAPLQVPGGSSVLLQVPVRGSSVSLRTDPSPVEAEMIVLDLGGDACEYDAADLTFRYRTSKPFVELTRVRRVPVPAPHEKPGRLLFPVYSLYPGADVPRGFTFDGVEVPDNQRACVVGVRRFRRPETFPLLLETLMPPDWRSMRQFQTLRDFTRADPRLTGRDETYAVPESFRTTRSMVASLQPVVDTPVFRSSIVSRVDPSGIEVRGTANAPADYLVSWPEGERRRGSAFYIEGELETGGLTVGLQRAERWVAQLNVYRPGPFRATIQVDADGPIAPVVANYLIQASRRNRFSIRKYGWIAP